ncbi:gene transfer agent family protein [Melghirimyces algeriensis]|uniref:Phage tail assembly chaperone protein, E, or 41 or 14 n=1 Tax=Melghirimyces algeriensis TaxID=910412 RepID=A0A521BNW5_9BACL|nr:gene transfer agent family protein [Melghirimyces algeriensis]SMO48822.1 hypothetical protein SAMN06264849_102248 [Melghirimyces algeriensis]
MANKQRGYVQIELDRPRRLKYDMNALTELEDALDRPVTQLNDQSIGIKELRALLWAGLIHEDRELTLEGAGELVEMENIQTVSEKVTEAMTLAFPPAQQKKQMGGPNGVGKKRNA